MGKVVDITDKLTFDGNPKLKIKGKELEINADAPTMLKVMALNENPGIPEVLETYNLMFTEKSRQEIVDLKLGFNDLVTVIQEGVALITGEDSSQGE